MTTCDDDIHYHVSQRLGYRYCPDCGQQLLGDCPSDAASGSAGWLPIASAPKDGTEIIVYCPPAHGLNHMASVCAWHEDAGFCVCELREPALWIPLPNARAMTPATESDHGR
jgi:hypothetical protein